MTTRAPPPGAGGHKKGDTGELGGLRYLLRSGQCLTCTDWVLSPCAFLLALPFDIIAIKRQLPNLSALHSKMKKS